MPVDLMTAIAHANRIIDWYENLDHKEVPPEWMWPFEDELETWFNEVDRKRKEKYGITDDDEDDPGGDKTPMMQNEFARGRG